MNANVSAAHLAGGVAEQQRDGGMHLSQGENTVYYVHVQPRQQSIQPQPEEESRIGGCEIVRLQRSLVRLAVMRVRQVVKNPGAVQFDAL